MSPSDAENSFIRHTIGPLNVPPGFTPGAPLRAISTIAICRWRRAGGDRKSTRLNSSHGYISYAVFCLKKKTNCDFFGLAPTPEMILGPDEHSRARRRRAAVRNFHRRLALSAGHSVAGLHAVQSRW